MLEIYQAKLLALYIEYSWAYKKQKVHFENENSILKPFQENFVKILGYLFQKSYFLFFVRML